LGYVHHDIGHHTHVLTCYRHALTLFRDLGGPLREADTLTRLDDTHYSTCNYHATRDAWRPNRHQIWLTLVGMMGRPSNK